MQHIKKEQQYRLQIWSAITSILVSNTTLHYEACSKLAGEKADEIMNEVRLMNLPNRDIDIKTVFPPY
jgi:hypothetical protein